MSRAFALIGGAVLAVGLLAFGAVSLRSARGAASANVADPERTIPKQQWTMPPLALLSRPEWSTGRKIAMLTIGGYLLIRDPVDRQGRTARRRVSP